MAEEADYVFSRLRPTNACHERREPTDDLSFSNGSPLDPLQLVNRQQQCLRLTVDGHLFKWSSPSTHYWYSQDMEWWYSAAKRVLDDIHGLLTSQVYTDRSFLFWVSLRGPWRCGPWKSDATWLSRFIHRHYEAEGRFLHPFRNKIDKHLKDVPDTLHFDTFLLQCWSDMTMGMSQSERRSYRIILGINKQAPETCLRIIERHMNMVDLASEPRGQPYRPPDDDRPWVERPSRDLEYWARLRPDLWRAHLPMFLDYGRHLHRERELELEAESLRTGGRPTEDSLALRRRLMTRQILAYIDCVVILSQREVGMVRGPRPTPGLPSTPSLGLEIPPEPTPRWIINMERRSAELRELRQRRAERDGRPVELPIRSLAGEN